MFLDARRQGAESKYPTLAKWMDVPLEKTLIDRELDLTTRALASESYDRKVKPGCTTSKQLGNCYTGSVYVNLATLVSAYASKLEDARVLLFSYGSGSIASMFTVRGRRASSSMRFSLERMASKLNIAARLAAREKVSAEEYSVYMDIRERVYGLPSTTPIQPIASIAPGAFYLEGIDAKFHRTYARRAVGSSTADESPSVASVAAGFSTKTATTDSWNRAGAVFVTGVSVVVPGQSVPCDGQSSLDLLLRGENCIEQLTDATKDAILSRNIVEVKRTASGEVRRHSVIERTDCVQVAAVVKKMDLEVQYGISKALVGSMDEPTQLAVAAGLDAMKSAKLVEGVSGKWRLAEQMQSSVGIIYATSFPTMNAAVAEANRFHESGDEAELDRKLLFRLLVLANAQLAQITGAKGPNTQINAACAGTTQAIGMAQDWLALGKCVRVVVIASDVASSETLMPWIAGGFRVLGAASTASTVEAAALPFDKRRNGMVLGGGAVGLVLESVAAAATRSIHSSSSKRVVRLLKSRFSNSAYHGASLDPKHVSEELVLFLLQIEQEFGISRAELAQHGVYYSHETFTNASPTASCAFTEVVALRTAFGDELSQLVICNTKGFTGHPMGVSFEDVVAVEGLRQGRVPPVANFRDHDEHLGAQPLRLAQGGTYAHKYALRFAAGFGSQLAFTLYALEA